MTTHRNGHPPLFGRYSSATRPHLPPTSPSHHRVRSSTYLSVWRVHVGDLLSCVPPIESISHGVCSRVSCCYSERKCVCYLCVCFPVFFPCMLLLSLVVATGVSAVGGGSGAQHTHGGRSFDAAAFHSRWLPRGYGVECISKPSCSES